MCVLSCSKSLVLAVYNHCLYILELHQEVLIISELATDTAFSDKHSFLGRLLSLKLLYSCSMCEWLFFE